VTHHVAKHAKVVPFRETTTFKALVFTAATPATAGVAVTGSDAAPTIGTSSVKFTILGPAE
jgi:hypothetical protein